MSSLYHYTTCGLAIASEIPLSGALDHDGELTRPDVMIRVGSVPPSLDGGEVFGANWEMVGDRFLFRVPGIATFLLTAGREIVCDAAPGVSEEELAIFVLGSVLGILMHQRGVTVLHASATIVGGHAVLFCGHSGAGKSTLAAALDLQGFACLTDDVCATTVGADGVPRVHSDGRRLKLWARSIEHLALGDRARGRVRRQLEKYYVEHAAVISAPVPLGAVYILRDARPPHVAGVDPLGALAAAILVRRHAYRPLLVGRMGQREQYFKVATTIAHGARVFHFTRRLEFDDLADSVNRLQLHWSELGLSEHGPGPDSSTRVH